MVSIIIPIYKVEPYVKQCIESVLCQTYRNLEVILVDDCTPDRSMELAQECIAQSPLSQDLHFVYLKHDHNRGLSAARNTGINAATGEYVYFLDSDDHIVPECLEWMTNLLGKYPQSEMVMAGAKASSPNYLFMDYESKKTLLPEYTENVDWINSAFLHGQILSVTAWNKLVNRTFIVQHHLFFVEGVINEDDLWHWMLSKQVAHLAILKKNTYNYVVRDGSIMHSATGTIERERNKIAILNYKVQHCSGRFLYREVSSIFGGVLETMYCVEDKKIIEGCKMVLKRLLPKASWRQKVGISLYLYSPLWLCARIHFRRFTMYMVGEIGV